ncbi:hypothetical protein D3C84_519540 [compost metagenome]
MVAMVNSSPDVPLELAPTSLALNHSIEAVSVDTSAPSLTLLPLALASSSGLPWATPVLAGIPGIFGISSLLAANAPTISRAVMVNGSEPFGSFQIWT